MLQKLVQQNIAELLGVSSLSLYEQEVFLTNVGELILESAVIRLVIDLTDEEETALSHYLETEPQSEVLVEHLIEHHSAFKTILKQEAQIFTKEAKRVFTNTAQKKTSSYATQLA